MGILEVFVFTAGGFVHVEGAVDFDHDRKDAGILAVVAGGDEGTGEGVVADDSPSGGLEGGFQFGGEPFGGVIRIGADAVGDVAGRSN